MAFDNLEFSLGPTRFSATIEYNTTIIIMDNGAEARNVNWDDARLKFDAGTAIKSTADLLTLIKFFRARKGAGRGFLVKDWTDYKATGEAIGTRTGTGAQTFQLKKTYTDAGNSDVREIYKPKSGTVVIYANGSALTFGTHYTIDYTTGVLTILAGQVTAGHVLTWDGEFYVPCRFASDELRADLILYRLTEGLGQMPQVLLIETRDYT